MNVQIFEAEQAIIFAIHRLMAWLKNTEMISVLICTEIFLWGITSFLSNMKTVHKWNMKVCDKVRTLDLRSPCLIFFGGQCKSSHQSQPAAFSPRLTSPSYFNRTVAGVDRAHSPDDVPASHFIISAWKLWSSMTAVHDWQLRNRESPQNLPIALKHIQTSHVLPWLGGNRRGVIDTDR